ncbi:YtxH domain-containing protein [Lysinibacillus sp. 3P01SB]|uniref:YtxH domain-containing protein n=1 Tax=Lysinibacillus sp. 3P01SB TaxID=3132284 RepID=UPI0039A727AB
MKAKTFLTGLSIGVFAGIATAIVTAPQPGQQLRSTIARNAAIFKHQLADIKNETTNVKQSITAFTGEAKNNIPKIINEMKDTITNFKNDIEPETAKLKQEIENLQNSIGEIEKNLSQNRKEESNNQQNV